MRNRKVWGVLGLLLALVVVVGYGQPQPQPPQPPQPQPPPELLLSIPAGTSIGDVIVALDFRPQVAEQLYEEFAVAFRATTLKETDTGRVVVFNIEDFEKQDPIKKTITGAMILGQETFSAKKPSVSLTVKSPRPIPIGILVFAERSSGIGYTLTATPIKPRGSSFTPIIVLADDVAVSVMMNGGPTYTFRVRGEEEPPLPLSTKEIVEVCKGTVSHFNRSYWKIEYKSFDVCQRQADRGYVRYGFIINRVSPSDKFCWLHEAGWRSTNPFDLTVHIVLGLPPRHRCTYEYIVLEFRP